MALLQAIGIEVKIRPLPFELTAPIAFEQDTTHASYDPLAVGKFHRILLHADAALKQFRGGFLGKCSPVHFFWGSFDLAVTRFSGRRAPAREGADAITREAYSHEVISHGFWPGGGAMEAAFYSYTAPAPEGLQAEPIRPAAAYYSAELKEFLLPYDAVRQASAPDAAPLEFMQTTYEAGARLADWDRTELEQAMQ